MLGIVVHPADVQDRDGAEELLRKTRRLFPFVEVIFADGGYQGPIMAAMTARTESHPTPPIQQLSGTALRRQDQVFAGFHTALA
jgi:hypothetical protein